MPKRQRADHSFERFDFLMKKNLELFRAPIDRSTNKKSKSRPLADGIRRDFWLGGQKTKKHWNSHRTAAYLAAYVEFQGRSIPGSGIRVEDGYVHPDRGVMCSLLKGGCVKFNKRGFQLTEKGWALIAPFVPASKEMAV